MKSVGSSRRGGATTGRARGPRFPPGGTLPTIVQDARDGTVLMLGHSSESSFRALLRRRELVLFGPPTGEVWREGGSSGHGATVVATVWDCDSDTLLVKVVPHGPICRTGSRSCFGDSVPLEVEQNAPVLHRLEAMVESRRTDAPKGSYTRELLENESRRLKKVGEEASELIVAAAKHDRKGITWEGADLLYHLTVLLGAADVRLSDLFGELAGRGSPRPVLPGPPGARRSRPSTQTRSQARARTRGRTRERAPPTARRRSARKG